MALPLTITITPTKAVGCDVGALKGETLPDVSLMFTGRFYKLLLSEIQKNRDELWEFCNTVLAANSRGLCQSHI